MSVIWPGCKISIYVQFDDFKHFILAENAEQEGGEASASTSGSNQSGEGKYTDCC